MKQQLKGHERGRNQGIPSQLKKGWSARGHNRVRDAKKPDFKSIIAAKLSQVQQMLNVSKADLSQEQLTALSQQVH